MKQTAITDARGRLASIIDPARDEPSTSPGATGRWSL